MTHLLGISGSLRRSSYNTALLRAAYEDLPDGVTAEIASLDGIPMYNWDDESSDGIPPEAEALRSKVAAADGIVIATPEYNFSVTGALKNAIDWLSRGPSSPIDFKPAAIIGAGGGGGTRRAQQHLRDMLTHNRLFVLAEPQVMVPGARMRFEDGILVDDSVRTDLRRMIEGLVALIERERGIERPETRGSILVAAGDAETADRLVRQTAERGYRSLPSVTAADAALLAASRSLAAAVIEATHPERNDLIEIMDEHHPQAPVVVSDAIDEVGAQLDNALHLELAGR